MCGRLSARGRLSVVRQLNADTDTMVTNSAPASTRAGGVAMLMACFQPTAPPAARRADGTKASEKQKSSSAPCAMNAGIAASTIRAEPQT